jgi:TatD DNase family protein
VIDSHCHLADDAFGTDLEQVVARAQAAGLSTALCVLAMGEPEEAARVPRIASLWPTLRFAIGVHPHEAGRFADSIDATIAGVRRAIGSTARVAALGEVGLDYHYDLSPRDVQRAIFRAQVALAGEMRLPVVVHTREAEVDTVALMEEAGGARLRGVLHCFTGTAEMARWAVRSGLYVSFAGIVTFQNAGSLRQAAAEVPLERLLVETDCPYLAPVPFRGTRNEPAFVVEVAKTVARVKGVSLETLDEAVTANFHALFGVR